MGKISTCVFLVISVVMLVKGEDLCSTPLGMQNKKISDKQITAPDWLHFKKGLGIDYAPYFARLNTKTMSGAWCSENIETQPQTFIEIDLLINKKITGIATQGRYNANEFVQRFQIAYQRDGDLFYRKYNESGIWKELNGNTHDKKVIVNIFKYPIIARKVRIYPRGDEFIIYCIRLELYGCKWAHGETGLVQYSAPLGGERQGINLKDNHYDGIKTKSHVYEGLGKLTDEIYGYKNFSKESPWVAYDMVTPEITFEFSYKRLLKQVLIHINNNGKDISIFESVEILQSSDNKLYVLHMTYEAKTEQINNIDAFAVVVDMGGINTQYLKLRFKKKSLWLLVSEVVFISDHFPFYPTKFIAPSRQLTPSTTNTIDVVTVKGPKNQNETSQKGLSFPIILTIALVTVVLTVVVTIIIYKSYQKKRKHEHSSRTDAIQTSPPPQLVSTVNKQEMALLYKERLLSLHQQQMMQHQLLQQQQQQQVMNGMYIHPAVIQNNSNSYNNVNM